MRTWTSLSVFITRQIGKGEKQNQNLLAMLRVLMPVVIWLVNMPPRSTCQITAVGAMIAVPTRTAQSVIEKFVDWSILMANRANQSIIEIIIETLLEVFLGIGGTAKRRKRK